MKYSWRRYTRTPRTYNEAINRQERELTPLPRSLSRYALSEENGR